MSKYTVAPYYSRRIKAMTQERVDWASIGRELGRVPRHCSDKWDSVQSTTENQRTDVAVEPTCSDYAATACSSTSSSCSSSSSSSPCSSSGDESSSSSGSSSGTESDSDSSGCSSQSSSLSRKRSIPASSSGQPCEVGASSGAEIGSQFLSATASTPTVRWTKEEVSISPPLLRFLYFILVFFPTSCGRTIVLCS